MRRGTIAIFILGSAAIASADVVHLTDGTTVEGIVRRSDDNYIVTGHGKTTTIPADQVASVEEKAASGADARMAAEKLTSLRRASENDTDLAAIVARYQRFIDTTTDPTALAGAKADLVTWQDRAAKHMVKIGDSWVPPEAQAGMADAAAKLAMQGHDLMTQNKLHEADPILTQAVQDDPRNATAQYLLGVLRYTQEALPAAKTAFSAAVTTSPDSAPSLNNLAVVLWRQRQYLAAMTHYDEAMLAAPVNRFLLDNVASALAELPADYKQSPVVVKARRRFDEQDRILQAQMAKMGLRRYGSTWIDDRQAAEMEQQRKQIQDKIDALSAEYDKQQSLIQQMDQRTVAIQAQMQQIAATSYTTDARGRQIAIPYPPAYAQMQQELISIQADKQNQQAKLAPLQQQARALQKQLPGGPATINPQQIVGPEGTPMPAGSPAAAMPTTQPGH